MAVSKATVTRRHYAIYKAEVGRAIRTLGLDDWNAFFEFKSLPGKRARVEYSFMGRTATFVLATYWPLPLPTDAGMREAARHEVLHLALAGMSSIGGSRWSTADEMNVAEEACVVRLQNRIRW